MSLLGYVGAALKGGAAGGISHNEKVVEDLRVQAERKFQERLIGAERTYQDGVRQQQWSREDTLLKDQRGREDSRNKVSDEQWQQTFALEQKKYQSDAAYKKALAASAGNDNAAKILKQFNDAMDDLIVEKANGVMSDQQFDDATARLQSRYYPQLGLEVPRNTGVIDPLGNSGGQGGEETTKDNAGQIEALENDVGEKLTREQEKQRAQQQLEEQGFNLPESSSDKMKGLLGSVASDVKENLGDRKSKYIRSEFERLVEPDSNMTPRAKTIAAWTIVRDGESVYPVGSKQRELALQILRASGADGVPTK